ncbi:hypothetical protein LCGC14_0933250, partial [marine sediment metagenome]
STISKELDKILENEFKIKESDNK